MRPLLRAGQRDVFALFRSAKPVDAPLRGSCLKCVFAKKGRGLAGLEDSGCGWPPGSSRVRLCLHRAGGEVPVTTGPEDPAAAGHDRLRACHADREYVIDTLKNAFVQAG